MTFTLKFYTKFNTMIPHILLSSLMFMSAQLAVQQPYTISGNVAMYMMKAYNLNIYKFNIELQKHVPKNSMKNHVLIDLACNGKDMPLVYYDTENKLLLNCNRVQDCDKNGIIESLSTALKSKINVESCIESTEEIINDEESVALYNSLYAAKHEHPLSEWYRKSLGY